MKERLSRILLLVTMLFGAAISSAQEPALSPLISESSSESSFDEWILVGGANFSFEDDILTGHATNLGRNSFLVSPRDYGDFILQTDVRLEAGNSGIQIRSRATKDKVIGYQIEIDSSSRAWSGGLYDESRRGWLASLEDNTAGREAFKLGTWNRYRIECVGPRIRTWINGVPCVDHIDTMDLGGRIAFQVHSGSNMHVQWRSPHIAALGKHQWRPLFDGSSLQGWHVQGGGEWKIEDAILIGHQIADDPAHGHLISDQRYDDFTLRAVFRSPKGNSGLYFRVDEGKPYGVLGFQAEIDGASGKTGGLYETAGRAWVLPRDGEPFKDRYRKDAWNEMTVHCNGGRIVVHVNGSLTAELTDDPGRLDGHIALQLHGNQDMQVEFKSIEILESYPE